MKKFEVHVSWTMATSIEIVANTREEATRRVLSGTRPSDGGFVPSSMHVDSVEEERGDEPSRRLRRIK
jgi:hypothetical protein